MSAKRFRILSAVYLLLISDNKEVALIRRFNTGYQDGNYTLPSGHIDEGETATTAMLREAKEEVNAKIKLEDLHFFHVIHRKSKIDVYVDFYYVATKWQGEIKSLEPNKCDDLSWFKIDKLPKNIIPDVKHAIQSYGKNNHYSELGW